MSLTRLSSITIGKGGDDLKDEFCNSRIIGSFSIGGKQLNKVAFR